MTNDEFKALKKAIDGEVKKRIAKGKIKIWDIHNREEYIKEYTQTVWENFLQLDLKTQSELIGPKRIKKAFDMTSEQMKPKRIMIKNKRFYIVEIPKDFTEKSIFF